MSSHSMTADALPTTAPHELPAERSGYAALRWIVAATFVVILNETVMFNALPKLSADFNVTLAAAQWLSTAFMLTMAVVIPMTGAFLQRVTTRRAFALAMTIFCAGTLLAALAPTFAILLVARVVQATGTAVIAEAVEAVVLEGKARIPRSGYFIRRGRGRVIIEQPEE